MIASKNSIGFLVDGFPRNQGYLIIIIRCIYNIINGRITDNVDGWQRTMSEKVKVNFASFANS